VESTQKNNKKHVFLAFRSWLFTWPRRTFKKKLKKKIIFFNCFDVLMLKLNFKKKYYFDIFLNKKYFKKQSLSRYQILP
jgi:hypothetical protein